MSKLKEYLLDAKAKGYAVPAFNYADIWEMEAIIEAAEEERSPVIIQGFARVVKIHSVAICASMADGCRKGASVPVFHHLDHSNDTGLCVEAVESGGYDSVMYDGSAFPLGENIGGLKQVVRSARLKDILVEGEIGQILGRSDESQYDSGDYLARAEDAIRVVSEADIDFLAIGIGNAHGFYKGEPKLHFDRLEEIARAVSVPLVLHGGTGIPEADIQRAIKLGISKLNVGTAILHAHATALQRILNEKGPIHIADLNVMAKADIRAVVKESIRMCMSTGRA